MSAAEIVAGDRSGDAATSHTAVAPALVTRLDAAADDVEGAG